MTGDQSYPRKAVLDAIHKATEEVVRHFPKYRKPDGRPDAAALTKYFKATAALSGNLRDEEMKTLAHWFDTLTEAEKEDYLTEALGIY